MPPKKPSKPKPTAWDDEPTPVPGSATELLHDLEHGTPAKRLDAAKAVLDAAHGPAPLQRNSATEWAKSIETAYAEPGEVLAGEQVYAAQRVAAKVAKLLKRSRVPHADQLRIAHLALLAVAAGPKSVSRDIAVTALKVVTS